MNSIPARDSVNEFDGIWYSCQNLSGFEIMKQLGTNGSRFVLLLRSADAVVLNRAALPVALPDALFRNQDVFQFLKPRAAVVIIQNSFPGLIWSQILWGWKMGREKFQEWYLWAAAKYENNPDS